MIIEKLDLSSLKIIDVLDYVTHYKVKFKKLTEDELNLKITVELLHVVKAILNHRWKGNKVDSKEQQHIFTFPGFWGYTHYSANCAGRILKDAIFDGRLHLNGVRFNFKDRFFVIDRIVYFVSYDTLPITAKVLIDSVEMHRKILLKNLIIKQNNL